MSSAELWQFGVGFNVSSALWCHLKKCNCTNSLFENTLVFLNSYLLRIDLGDAFICVREGILVGGILLGIVCPIISTTLFYQF